MGAPSLTFFLFRLVCGAKKQALIIVVCLWWPGILGRLTFVLSKHKNNAQGMTNVHQSWSCVIVVASSRLDLGVIIDCAVA